jgi:ABC-type multidrug transport system permease subunit
MTRIYLLIAIAIVFIASTAQSISLSHLMTVHWVWWMASFSPLAIGIMAMASTQLLKKHKS